MEKSPYGPQYPKLVVARSNYSDYLLAYGLLFVDMYPKVFHARFRSDDLVINIDRDVCHFREMGVFSLCEHFRFTFIKNSIYSDITMQRGS